MGNLDGPLNQYVTPLVSMVKNTGGSTVWSDGPQNKYDPGEVLLLLYAGHHSSNIKLINKKCQKIVQQHGVKL